MTAVADPPIEAPQQDRLTLGQVLLRPSVVVIALMGAVIRAWILWSPQGALNADEAYTGLQALEIARGHFPVVIGGAAYTGTLDTYALAPILWIAGGHVILLKLMSPVLWAVAAVLAVGAGRRVLDDRAALVCGGLVWLAPGALAVVSTRSYVGYGLALGVVTAAIWTGLALAQTDQLCRRAAALFGLLVGLAFYTHPMFGAIVGPAAAVVAARHRREGRRFWLPAVTAAVAVNVPFLIWNARNDWPSRHQPTIPTQTTYTERLRGMFVGLLPRDLGVRRYSGAWTFGRPVAALVVIAVLGLAAYGACSLWRRDRWAGAVLAAPLVLCWPMLATLRNFGEIADGRYGIVVLPILALTVTIGASALWRAAPAAAPAAVLAGWVLLCTVPFLYREVGTDRVEPNVATQQLIDVLETEGFDRVAGNYGAVLPIEYMSGGDIRVAIAGNPYVIRLPHTQRMVDATPADRLAYVFAPGPIGPTWVKLPVEQYRQVPVAGWVVYFPPAD